MHRRRFLSLSAMAGITPTLGGCEKISDWLDATQENRFEWTEDVPLIDGRTLVVKRSARLSANSIAGGGGGSFNKGMTLEIASPRLPDTPAAWSDVYVPLLLDQDPKSKEWILVATFFHCDSWYNLGSPPLPYTEYRFRQGRWQRQALSTDLIGRLANLYIADQKPKTSHLTESYKRSDIANHPGTSKEYLMVTDNWSSGC